MSRDVGPRFKTITPFQKDNFSNDNLEQIQSNIQSFISSMTYIPILRGRLIDDIILSDSITNRIEHRLNRMPNGYLITKMDAPSIINHGGFDNRFLLLEASFPTTIGLWVF
jgi:hypothetical protein